MAHAVPDAGMLIFFTRPISGVLVIAALAAVAVPLVRAVTDALRRHRAVVPT